MMLAISNISVFPICFTEAAAGNVAAPPNDESFVHVLLGLGLTGT